MKAVSPTYDAIVVGLGPAGAVAAFELARAGRSVLGLDGRVFPRYKVCGGGLSARVDGLLGLAYHETVECTVSGMTFAFEGRDAFTVDASRPVASFVMRDRFDAYLAERASQAGARLQFGEPVLEIEEALDHVWVRTSRATYQAAFVVGADGAVGLASRRLNGPSRRAAYGLEAEVRAAGPPDRVVMEMGLVPGGYGWRFPKDGRWSVGMAGFRGAEPHPKRRFARMLSAHAFPPAPDGSPLGHPIPIYAPELRLASSRIGLAGDAARLVDPFFGEGIYYAIASGRQLGQTVARQLEEGTADLAAYRRWVETTLYPEFAAAARLAELAYTYPRLWFDAMRAHPDIVREFYRILQGEIGYADLWARLKRDAWRLAPGALAARAIAWFAGNTSPRSISS
ncbi:MAG: geranylgeranyl reductase family protein [Nitrospiria bacterium]